MVEQIHGHEVMAMMMASDEAYTAESLRDAIVTQFGEDARFYTCSAEGLDAAALVAFLEGKGKFVPHGEGFNTHPDKVCNH